MTQFRENFFFNVAEAVGVSEKESAGDYHECRKNQPSAFCGDAARLHAPFKDGKGNHEHDEDAMKEDFWILERDPKAIRAERPSLGITSQKEERGQPEKDEGPVSRPREMPGLR